jgi:ABC-2 type transport system ATP-binding protein
MSISIQNLTKDYSGNIALKNINLEIAKGEIFGLIGKNGAGKTTLVKIILGFSKASSGDVRILEEKNSVVLRKRIGYLPEKVVIHPFLNPVEFLNFTGKLCFLESKTLKTTIPEVLERVGLIDKQKEKIGNFSKGMTQRLGLAQAILHKPEILLLDEPGSGLDPSGLIDLRNIILEENKNHKTTIFLNSHRLMEAEKLCNRIAILHKGELVASGSMDELTKKKNQISIQLESISGEVESYLKSISKNFRIQDKMILIEPNDDTEVRYIPKKLIDLNATILRYEIQNEDLEEVFLRVTGNK